MYGEIEKEGYILGVYLYEDAFGSPHVDKVFIDFLDTVIDVTLETHEIHEELIDEVIRYNEEIDNGC